MRRVRRFWGTCSVAEARPVMVRVSMASTMGALAVDLLCEGKSNRVVGYRHGDFVDDDIDEALAMQKSIPEYQYQISKNLSM